MTMANAQRQITYSSAVYALGELAEQALLDEINLTPKPGLVDNNNTGSHTDLSVALMQRSARCLSPYFTMIADCCEGQTIDVTMREAIGQLGRDAEQAMLIQTRGVNTHRGAIWALGLLTAATVSQGTSNRAEAICEQAGKLARLSDRFVPKTTVLSNGKKACRQFQVSGAKAQAQAGFPMIVHTALPRLRQSRKDGESETIARLNALVAIMAVLTDTCVLSRSGLQGQRLMHETCKTIIAVGGVGTLQGMRLLKDLDKQMIQINASPGGAADLLAATLFVDAIEGAHIVHLS